MLHKSGSCNDARGRANTSDVGLQLDRQKERGRKSEGWRDIMRRKNSCQNLHCTPVTQEVRPCHCFLDTTPRRRSQERGSHTHTQTNIYIHTHSHSLQHGTNTIRQVEMTCVTGSDITVSDMTDGRRPHGRFLFSSQSTERSVHVYTRACVCERDERVLLGTHSSLFVRIVKAAPLEGLVPNSPAAPLAACVQLTE